MNNETLDRLRLPGAWVLIGSAGAIMLAALIKVIASASYPSSFSEAMNGYGGAFFALTTTLLIVASVALVVTSPRFRPSAAPVVIAGLVLVGIGLLFALISVITAFLHASEMDNIGHGFGEFIGILGHGAVLGFVGFALLKVFNDPVLVPRAMPQQQGQYNPQQPFPPATGAQQSFAQPGYPAQGASTTQFPVADPTMTGSGQQQTYGQQAAYDASVQQYGADAAAQQQAAYGQQQAYGTGGQQAYDPSQQAYAQQYGADAAAQQQAYGTGAQQAYGQQYGQDAQQQAAYDAQQQQAAYDAQQQAAYDAQQQAAYGQQYGTDAASGQQQAYGYGTGGQQVYDPSQQQAYGYGTGGQQAYDPSQQAYAQQYGTDAAAQQGEYAQAYDPAQYAPQPYDGQQGADRAQPSASEQAAQDAIQYGWYQGTDQAQPAQDTPPESGVEPFFNSGENTGTETPGQGGGSYGGQYGSGSGYSSDQQGQGGNGDQQSWYGSDDQR